MDVKKIVDFRNFSNLIANLAKTFPTLEPAGLRDLLFFLQEFGKSHPIPRDAKVYLANIRVEGLEVLSKRKVSKLLIQGLKKFPSLGMLKGNLSPVVIVKGGVREIIIYGELHAVESYARSIPVRAIVLDLGDSSPFGVFKFNELGVAFLLPLIQVRSG